VPRPSFHAEPPLIVSVHDVAPATAAETRGWLADLAGLGVPAVLLVVPGPWRGPGPAEEPGFGAELLRAADSGHELALHGWSHAAQPGGDRSRRWSGQVAARGAGEFWTLDAPQARARIDLGLGALRAVGIEPQGFVPPGYLASPGTKAALAASGLRYWTSHFAVHDLRADARHTVVALSHRPAMGARGRPFGERSGDYLIARSPQWFTRRGRPLRLALHPDDLHRAGLRDTTLRAIEHALALGARAMTYTQLLDRLVLAGDSSPKSTANPAAAAR
jgi:predicted deacetylase